MSLEVWLLGDICLLHESQLIRPHVSQLGRTGSWPKASGLGGLRLVRQLLRKARVMMFDTTAQLMAALPHVVLVGLTVHCYFFGDNFKLLFNVELANFF